MRRAIRVARGFTVALVVFVGTMVGRRFGCRVLVMRGVTGARVLVRAIRVLRHSVVRARLRCCQRGAALQHHCKRE